MNYQFFRRAANVILGIMLGFLIGMPVMMSTQSPVMSFGCFIFPIAGGLVGYKRRDSSFFLYFALLSILALSVILTSKLGAINN